MKPLITSTANPAIKAIRKLSDRKYRQQTNTCLIEGLRVVGEAMQTNVQFETLIYAPDHLHSDFGETLIKHAEASHIAVLPVSAAVFDSISNKDNPQGLAAVVKQQWHQADALEINSDTFFLALDSIQNPGNLGTIIRTADATGVSAIFLLDQCTDPYDATAIKASMGSIFNLKLIKLSTAEFIGWAETHQITLIGSSDKGAMDYQQAAYPLPCALLMGSEREGLNEEQWQACQTVVKIPMLGRLDSLNLSVATGVILYEIFNRNRKMKDGQQS